MKIEQIAEVTKKKPKKLAPVKEPRTIEREYYRGLKRYTKQMKEYVRRVLMPELKKLQPQYTMDSYADDLQRIFENMKQILITAAPVSLAANMVKGTEKANRRKYASRLNSAFGIDLESVLRTEGLQAFTEAQIAKNATLIKSIPEEFIKNIETIVYNGVTSGLNYSEIAKQISGIKDVSSAFGKIDNRVKTIARNEVSTINSQITQARQRAIGIDMYIWRTSQDERVRGNPSGKYPNARPRHDTMEGKYCRWDDPSVYADSLEDAKEGKWKKRSSINAPSLHAGEPINCRCTAEAVIDI
jgi:SPP1 gp7 family putative phage head morphogenesis protein